MARIHVIFFAVFLMNIQEFRTEDTQELKCSHKNALTMSGVKDQSGLWNTSFTLEKWNATNNWTLLVQHTATEVEGKRLSYMRGYLADGEHNVTADGMKRIWGCESSDSNGNPKSIVGQQILKDFGVIPYPKWNTTVISKFNTLKYWQTSSDCRGLESCRTLLSQMYKDQISSNGHILDNFHIVPDGKILEVLGWENINLGEIRINLISKAKDVNPTKEALEAFGYLVQVGVSLGKLKKNFFCNVPPHTASSVDTEVRKWSNDYRNNFDSDSSLSRVSLDDYLQVVTRLDWNAITPMRELDHLKTKAEIVEVRMITSSCLTHEDCAKKIEELQEEEMKAHSDLFSNFIIGSDGRIYEGLGWTYSRKVNVIYFDFLVPSANSIPWTQALTAFTLQLREGVDLGKISEKFTINMPSNANRTVYTQVMKWGEWTRNIVKENVTITLHTIGGDASLVSRIDSANQIREKEVFVSEYPIGTVLYIQRSGGCNEFRNCLPFQKSLGAKSIKSPEEVKSNFYFTGDGMLYEGLGWNATTKEDEVTFEFMTSNPSTLPSNRSMAASVFLIREGLEKGYLSSNYQIKVGKHTSIAFENLVRFWDTRIRQRKAN